MRIRPVAWLYRASWGERRPSIGGDEYGRHTVVVPWPITRRRDELGYPLCSALVVALPWFPCDCLDEDSEPTRS